VTPPVRALALRIGVVDQPGGRHVHARPVPRLGGLAVLAAGLATLAIAPAFGVTVVSRLAAGGWGLGWLAAGVAVVVVAGVVDDVRGLGPRAKLGLQAVAAALALGGGFGLAGVTNPFTGTYVEFGLLGVLLTLLWVVAITNAMNLIDGLDGLAAGVALIGSATLLAVSLAEGRADAALLWAVLAGALAGFLPYNFSPATIFLGDSGSLLIGYLMSVLALQSLEKGVTAVLVLVPILALGLPIMDVLLALLRRALGPEPTSLFRADREHIHHRLVGGGMTHRRAVLVLYAVCVAFSALAFLAVVVQGPGNALVVAAGGVVMFVGVRRFARRRSGGER
jgi:UDP-GlcNAc:undecaprenyl-phosphate/decaprenyl-phosphate GlcNAc-1-phosphate transferase